MNPSRERRAPAFTDMKKTITAFAAAFAIVLGGAAAAAVADPYVPSGPAAGPATMLPGGVADFGFGGFVPGESVVFTLTGENASGATLASAGVLAARETKTSDPVPADPDGAASIRVTLPANASGTYTLLADAPSGSIETTFAVSVAATGVEIPAWLIWGAVGAVGLGVIALIAVSAARRTRRELVSES